MKDRAFLSWLHARLTRVHGEMQSVDYMRKLQAILNATPEDRETPNSSLHDTTLANLGDGYEDMMGRSVRNPAGKVNLNTMVRLVLSPKGWAIYNALRDHERDALAYNLTLTGVLTLPLWQFASVFGPHIYQSAPVVAQNNEVELLEDPSLRITPAPKPLRKTTVKKGRAS